MIDYTTPADRINPPARTLDQKRATAIEYLRLRVHNGYVLPAHQHKLLLQLTELLKSDAPTMDEVVIAKAAA